MLSLNKKNMIMKNKELRLDKAKEKVILLVVLLFAGMPARAQVEQLTKESKTRFGSVLTVGVTTGMSPMKDYWSQRGVALGNPQFAKAGAGVDVSIFFIDNLAYTIRLTGSGGRLLTDLGNEDVSMLGIEAVMGFEYYATLGEKNQLSVGVGIGGDEYGYFHDNAAARYNNIVLPFSVTFWHKRYGVMVAYDWCVGKGRPLNNAAGLPRQVPGVVTFGFRLR